MGGLREVVTALSDGGSPGALDQGLNGRSVYSVLNIRLYIEPISTAMATRFIIP